MRCQVEPGLLRRQGRFEMLTRTLAAEQQEPTFRAITVRPGVIDTDMQLFARSQTPDILPSVELFKGFHREGRLVAPGVVASKIVPARRRGRGERPHLQLSGALSSPVRDREPNAPGARSQPTGPGRERRRRSKRTYRGSPLAGEQNGEPCEGRAHRGVAGQK